MKGIPRSAIAGVATLAMVAFISAYHTKPLPTEALRGLAPPTHHAPSGVGVGASVLDGAVVAPPLAPVASPLDALPLATVGGSGTARAVQRTGPLTVPANTPGVGTSTIRLGFTAIDNASFNGLPNRAEAQAVVDSINRHGGIAGRQIVPVFYAYDAASVASATSRDVEAQQACAAWTGSDPVFAFFPWWGLTSQTMLDCATANHVIDIDPDLNGPVMTTASPEVKSPYHYFVSRMDAERRDRAYVNELADLGFFKGRPKIGLVVDDSPTSRAAADHALLPELQKRKGTAAIVAEADYPDPLDSPWPVYVAQFRQAGVDRVLFSSGSIDSLAALSFVSAAHAASPTFQPRYGFTSEVDPAFLASVAVSAKATEQLKASIGLGWSPLYDTGKGADTAEQRDCSAIGAAAHLDSGYIGFYCEALFFLQTALDNAKELSGSGIAKALDDFASYHSVLVDGEQFAPGRHYDGAMSGRPFAFQDTCSCFQYTARAHQLTRVP